MNSRNRTASPGIHRATPYRGRGALPKNGDERHRPGNQAEGPQHHTQRERQQRQRHECHVVRIEHVAVACVYRPSTNWPRRSSFVVKKKAEIATTSMTRLYLAHVLV